MQLETEKDLSAFNTLAVPAKSSHYIKVDSLALLREAVDWAKQCNKKVYVLAGGSNVILSNYIDGLVIQPKMTGIELVERRGDDCFVRAGAGENWHDFVDYCVGRQFYGIENLALIPGDVGASPIQNIGAYGVELKDVFHSLEALDCETGELCQFDQQACQFSYRDSIFKSEAGQRYIICSVTFKLSAKANVQLQYPALKNALAEVENPSPSEVMQAVIRIRRSKLPDPAQIPNAGSFFKNPVVDIDAFNVLQEKFPDVAAFDADKGRKKIAAAWLIDQAGWKGKNCNGVRVHDHHALVLTNPEHCDSQAIFATVKQIQTDVMAMFGVHLEVEPRILD